MMGAGVKKQEHKGRFTEQSDLTEYRWERHAGGSGLRVGETVEVIWVPLCRELGHQGLSR